jgi:hypothetical protein
VEGISNRKLEKKSVLSFVFCVTYHTLLSSTHERDQKCFQFFFSGDLLTKGPLRRRKPTFDNIETILKHSWTKRLVSRAVIWGTNLRV